MEDKYQIGSSDIFRLRHRIRQLKAGDIPDTTGANLKHFVIEEVLEEIEQWSKEVKNGWKKMKKMPS